MGVLGQGQVWFLLRSSRAPRSLDSNVLGSSYASDLETPSMAFQGNQSEGNKEGSCSQNRLTASLELEEGLGFLSGAGQPLAISIACNKNDVLPPTDGHDDLLQRALPLSSQVAILVEVAVQVEVNRSCSSDEIVDPRALVDGGATRDIPNPSGYEAIGSSTPDCVNAIVEGSEPNLLGDVGTQHLRNHLVSEIPMLPSLPLEGGFQCWKGRQANESFLGESSASIGGTFK